VPQELLAVDPLTVFTAPAKKNRDLLDRVQAYGETAARERSLRLQLIGAVKMRELSSGRKAKEYEKIEAKIRAEIKNLESIELKRGGFFSRLNPFD